MLNKCLRWIHALLIYQSKSLKGEDVSHFAGDIPGFYKDCSRHCARMKSIIYEELSKSSSDSDSNSDLDDTNDSSSGESDDGCHSRINKKVASKDK